MSKLFEVMETRTETVSASMDALNQTFEVLMATMRDSEINLFSFQANQLRALMLVCGLVWVVTWIIGSSKIASKISEYRF